jgi:hypothetical protein
MHQSSDQYKRFYPKLQNLVAGIGGILNIVMIRMQLVTSFITKRLFIFDYSLIFSHNDKININKKIKMNNYFRESSIKLNQSSRVVK